MKTMIISIIAVLASVAVSGQSLTSWKGQGPTRHGGV